MVLHLPVHNTGNNEGMSVIVNLIGNTTNAQALRVHVALDKRRYPASVKITDTEFNQVNLRPSVFHGDWNYTICPNRSINRKAA